MAFQNENGNKTFIATNALARYRRVKLTTAKGDAVEYAGAGEDHIGVTQGDAAAGELVTVRLTTAPGTLRVVAGAAIDVGASLYGAANGKVSSSSNGPVIGKGLKAASGDDSVIEMAPFNVKPAAAGAVSIADAGGFTATATVEAALAEIYQGLLTAQATIPVPLAAITQEDGTPLVKLNSTASGFSQLDNKEQVIAIPVDATIEALGFSVPVPQDLDDSEDVKVHVLAGKAANNDALTLDCEVYPVAAGDGANADIQDTAAQTIPQAISEIIFTCGADGVLAAPGTLTAVLTLGGVNDGDAVYIYGVWIEYTRKILAA